MKFSDIPAHEEVKSRLVQMVSTGRMPHALLISGPEGSGALAMGRALAQYLQCTSPVNGDSCGECPSCVQHRSLNHADMHYVFPVVKRKSEHLIVSNDYLPRWREYLQERTFSSLAGWLAAMEGGSAKAAIAVEEAAGILRVCSMSTYTSPVKIVLVWLPEKLGVEAANKLLKVIEEPWEDTRFIFVSHDPAEILPTVYSRTQRVNLPRLSDAQLAQLLERDYSVNAAEAEAIARMADGNACTAIEALERRGEREEFATMFREVMRKAYSRDVKALRELADRAAGMGREKNVRLLEYFASQVRENFIYNLRMPPLNRLTQQEEQFSSRFSPFVNAANAEDILADLDSAARDIGGNANAKIVMFDTMLRLIVLLIRKPQP